MKRPYIHATRGAAMLFALLLIAVAGLLTAGWITLVTARSAYVGVKTAAIQRRVALENSKALAQEFMLERVLPSASGSNFGYSLTPSGWGGITVPAWAWSDAPMRSVLKPAGYNPFNPGNGDGFASPSLTITLHNGDDSPSRNYQIKSRSPLLAGALLTSQSPLSGSSSPIGGLSINGGAFVWQPSLAMTFRAQTLATPKGAGAGAYANLANGTLALNNLALPRQVANPRDGSFYGGQFDAVNNAHAAANSSHLKALDSADGALVVDGEMEMSSNGVICDGLGNVTITLSTLELGNVYIPGKITSLTLDGQAMAGDVIADDRKAILIMIDQPDINPADGLPPNRDLATVILDKHNNRRVVLAVKKREGSAGALSLVFPTAGAAWRLLLEAEGTPLTLVPSGAVIIQGGIRTDRAIVLTADTVSVSRENDGKYLERLATRTAWVESLAQ